MTYADIATIAQDGLLTRRVLACAWVERVPDPPQWTADNIWALAASPGWAEAWNYARQTHDEPAYRPGADEGVITDAMILSAVQARNETPVS